MSSTVTLMASAGLVAAAGAVASAARDDPQHVGATIARRPLPH
jgi:hypothetical protein